MTDSIVARTAEIRARLAADAATDESSDEAFLLGELDRIREILCGWGQHDSRMRRDGWCSYCETGTHPDDR